MSKTRLGKLPSFPPADPAAPASPSVDAPPAPDPNRPQRRRRRGGTRTRADGRVLLQTYHHPAGIDQLRALAEEQEAYVTDMVTEAINDLLRKYGRPPVA